MTGFPTLLAALALGTAHAKPAEAQTPDTIVVAKKARKISTEPTDKQWLKASPMEVQLSRQRTIPLMDMNANEKLNTGPNTQAATVRVLYTAEAFGVWVQWADATQDELNTEEGGYGDAAALSLPVQAGAGVDLPYVGMGDIDHPVVIASKRANRHETHERQFIAAGFGSLKPIDINTEMSLTYDEAAQTWTAVYVRPFADGNVNLTGQAVIPFSLALWNGSDLERGGYKAVMRWHAIQLDPEEADPTYVDALRWGEDGREIGDVDHGRELAGQLCVACHHFDGKAVAMAGIAPNLTNVGLQASASYIRDSILEPSKVVVRNPNGNRHYAKGGEKDHRGGYAMNPMYQWYTKTEAGEYQSKMPKYGHLSESDVNDIVAYLKSLGSDAPVNAESASPQEQ